MTKEQALAILKQPDRIGCNLIKATDEESCKYNQESIEAFNMAVSSLDKLEKIEQIVNSWDGSIVLSANDWKYISEIKKVLEQE